MDQSPSGRPINELLQFYAIERFLYRLSQSRYRGAPRAQGRADATGVEDAADASDPGHRLARPVSNDLESVRSVIADICRQTVADDGLVFDLSALTTERIAEDADYAGVRARFPGGPGHGAGRHADRLRVQRRDHARARADYVPDAARPRRCRSHGLQPRNGHRGELEAMVSLGQLNSRMKDFFDLWLLARSQDFDGRIVAEAIKPA